MAEYSTKARWVGGHRGELSCSNGATIPFSAPVDLHGEANVLTPEDAFVGALNSCYMLMFIWAAERLKIHLVSYECEAEGHVKEYLDKTSTFNRVVLRLSIGAQGCDKRTIEKALKLAEKYSLIWQSINADVVLEPEITIIR
jgi:organic hydroperoxide reductase OsmC/OhrA